MEKATLGIELGSTRIKAVLIDENQKTLATGSYHWENKMENGVWTYDLQDAVKGLRACYTDLRLNVERQYGKTIQTLAGIGISGMMHGYLAFDRDDRLLVPFRTWRNTMTEDAAQKLSQLFHFNIPQRWSIAHLYQAILNGEPHVPEIAHLTTLSGYVHYMLTGKRMMGICEASGMFPLNAKACDFDGDCLEKFDKVVKSFDFPWNLRKILPVVMPAGEIAGYLTEAGAALLDETSNLQPGIPFCPPEGDAGTGMVATGAVEPRTGSISAGTSAFSLQVLERPLEHFYPEIDVVATPSGKPVAMAHTNTCTSEIDAWIGLFADVAKTMGWHCDTNSLYSTLFRKAMEGEPDCGKMVSFNYFAGEPLTGTETGRLMLVRMPESHMSAANFMRCQLYGAIATLKIGMDMLKEKENVISDRLLGHGGFFKTPGVGQQIMADALNVPITTMETAGEGGPWGMAVLASFMAYRDNRETLENFLSQRVFAQAESTCLEPDPAGVQGFRQYLQRFCQCLDAEKSASKMR